MWSYSHVSQILPLIWVIMLFPISLPENRVRTRAPTHIKINASVSPRTAPAILLSPYRIGSLEIRFSQTMMI